MATRIVHNLTTGEAETIEVDDAYILAHRSSVVVISVSATQVAVNGTLDITAQLLTPILADGSQNPLNQSILLEMQLGDMQQVVSFVNGQWADSLQFVVAGVYRISCLDLPSNEISIEVL